MEKLYRYLGGNDNSLLSYLKDIFENRRMWFSDPFQFNDPMELNCRIDYDRNYDLMEGSLLFEVMRNNGGELSEEVWSTLSDEVRRIQFHSDLSSGLKDLFRIICLSRNCNNNLMWSHYAKNHSGICLVLKSDFVECIDQGSEVILAYGDVEYVDEPPLIRSFHDHTDNVIKEMLFNKSTDWSYECEYRVLAHGARLDNNYASLDKNSIVGVILGAKSSVSLQKYCVEKIKCEMGFSVKKATLNNFSYKMDFLNL